MTGQWMIYGANGYTGELIARQAVSNGLSPVLAGRNRQAVETLAAELKLDARVFLLDAPETVSQGLDGIDLVLLAAGPFSATSRPMMDACLERGCHYLDITGEIAVFEAAQALDERARKAGCVLCPGVGFDVIPTDCLALALKQALPDATHLRLGFDSRSGPSPGTAKTAIEGLADGGRIRRDGQIETVPLAYRTDTIDFGDGPRFAVTIPWGDVATAYHTTGIPNIETLIPMSPRTVRRMRRANLIRPLLRFGTVQRLLKAQVDKRVRGPDDQRRQATPTHVWGEARNAAGDCVTARVITANGYEVTRHGALAVVQHVLHHAVSPGATSPARLMGANLVNRLPGSGETRLENTQGNRGQATA
ncbi:MAG: saccharopine dehydrogenase NADP-binding domain-containing protein [Ectothiorhodospiraceae bacterium]|nr:saccharopine dehydrogenase NADP-binding domain-containing protein [Ectothiorhodospiraceae bacterium]MCH8503856.1 saccharopine dehydrogenase NADP-binding domain-containing protein [Ectothiorhodospiraceae bacterium]